MPFILGANEIKSTGYEVANSCRFDTNAGMNKTAGNGTRTKATFSAWVKRSVLGDESLLFNSRIDASNHFLIRFTGGDALELVNRISASNISFYTTNALYRDPSAWMHVLWIIDTTLGTAGDRIKLFVNGTRVTSWATSTTQNQDTNLAANINTAEYYVAQEYTSGDNYFDGYLAEVVYLDGVAASSTDFGEFSEDSPQIWIPKDVSGLTFGTSGFYLDFEDSSNLGNDKNGGTDLTENNLAATDQTTDTCTNNFCTLNPLNVPTANAPVFSEGNTKVVTPSASGGYYGGSSTMGVTSGKWYFEFITDSDPSSVNSTFGMTYNPGEDARNNWHAAQLNDHCWAYNLGDGKIYYNNTAASYGDTLTTSDILGMAVDLDNHKIYWAKNNTWQNSGNPESGSTGTGAYSLDTDKTYFVTVGDVNSTPQATIQVNFGNPYKALSSAANDANGYGSFEYAPPDGYYSLCTKNLAEFGG